jgi:hypothetical protein
MSRAASQKAGWCMERMLPKPEVNAKVEMRQCPTRTQYLMPDHLPSLAMPKSINLKKILLVILIVSLIISALIAITILLTGSFGTTQQRLLLTTLTTAGYSFTGLSCSVLFKRQRLAFFAILGISISAIGAIYTTALIWGDFGASIIWGWKCLFTLVILAISVAHSSLLLLIQSKKVLVNGCLWFSVASIIALAATLIYLIYFQPREPTDFYLRLIGTLAVLDVLGTIATPIMKKVTD